MNASKPDRPPRADAARNREAILDAAVACLIENPRASIAEIAKTAGVGRVTLYGHFSSREELLQSAFRRTMDRAEAQLSALDLDGAPWDALDELVQSAWRIVAQFNGVLAAAEHEVSAETIREYHDRPLARLQRLLGRGRTEGAFRTDMTVEWQIACYYGILTAAAAELRAGRLTEQDAARLIPETLRGVLDPTRAAQR